MKRLNQDEVINRMKKLEPEYNFSKFVYVNNKHKSIIICNKGHEYMVHYNSFVDQGRRCPYCSGNHKFSQEEAINRMKELEPEYNFDKFIYTNSETKSIIICDKGHEYNGTFDNFVNRKCRCPHCKNKVSKPEKEIIEFIKSIYDGNIEHSNKDVIKNNRTGRYLELDIYLPELNLAIEFNGKYYHSNNFISKRGWNSAKEKHDYKTSECFKNNIFLLHINEEDWIKDKNSILNRIKRLIEISRRL